MLTTRGEATVWLGFQGSRLHLELNTAAAIRLRDALDRAVRGRADSAPVQRLTWQLPDDRPLDVSVHLTSEATDPDDNGDSGDTPARGDMSGDFEIHAAVCGVIAAATGRYTPAPRSSEDAAAHDHRRIDDALDRYLPICYGAAPLLRDDIRRRAIAAADTTRPRRLGQVTPTTSS